MIYVFLADGFEEAEALVPIDIMRRGGFDVKTVGVTSAEVTGAHGITVRCDITENKAVTDGLEAVVLPGGMPGTLNLEKSETVNKIIRFACENGLLTGAICAAPSILGKAGLLKGKRATCFPGFEKDLSGAIFTGGSLVCDGNIITAVGAGAAFDFGFALLAALKDVNTARKLADGMMYKR